MTIEPFDAVLAETRKIQTIHDFHLDRLAAAHEEELRKERGKCNTTHQPKDN